MRTIESMSPRSPPKDYYCYCYCYYCCWKKTKRRTIPRGRYGEMEIGREGERKVSSFCERMNKQSTNQPINQSINQRNKPQTNNGVYLPLFSHVDGHHHTRPWATNKQQQTTNKGVMTICQSTYPCFHMSMIIIIQCLGQQTNNNKQQTRVS